MSGIFLYLVVSGSAMGGGYYHMRKHPMPDRKTCEQAVENSKVGLSNGDENETAVIMFCAKEGFSYGNTKWWKEENR